MFQKWTNGSARFTYSRIDWEQSVVFWWRRKVWIAFAIVMLISLAGMAVMLLLSLTASPPLDLGIRDGRFASCPDSPNCVSTQAEDHDHWIAPLTVQQHSYGEINVLEAIVLQMPRTKIIEKTTIYLRVEFRSAIFRFVDDVEFYMEPESSQIHFRSASRVGRSDLGVNRARMEQIRDLFQTAQNATGASTNLLSPSGKLQPAR